MRSVEHIQRLACNQMNPKELFQCNKHKVDGLKRQQLKGSQMESQISQTLRPFTVHLNVLHALKGLKMLVFKSWPSLKDKGLKTLPSWDILFP